MSGQRYEAMMVEEYVDGQGQGRSKWTKIGAAFTNRDGSIGIQLAAFPIGGKVVLQIPMSKEEREAKFGSHGQAMRQQTGTGGGRQQRGGPPRQGGFANYGGRTPPAPRAPAAAPAYPASFDDHDDAGNEGDPGGFADDQESDDGIPY